MKKQTSIYDNIPNPPAGMKPPKKSLSINEEEIANLIKIYELRAELDLPSKLIVDIANVIIAYANNTTQKSLLDYNLFPDGYLNEKTRTLTKTIF